MTDPFIRASAATEGREVVFTKDGPRVMQGHGRWRRDLGPIHFEPSKPSPNGTVYGHSHAAVLVAYRGDTIQVDCHIFPIVASMWKNRFLTFSSCEGDPNATHSNDLASVCTTRKGAQYLVEAIKTAGIRFSVDIMYQGPWPSSRCGKRKVVVRFRHEDVLKIETALGIGQ